MMRILCDAGKKVYFVENGYFCSGYKGKSVFIRPKSIVKHGLYEGDK